MREIRWHTPPSVIEAALEAHLPPAAEDDDRFSLREAMRYATLGGGKRLRSLLVLEAAAAVGCADVQGTALSAACALELIHAYSLVHDDLPAMDNAELRRGKPSCHVRFGQSTAILAGDGLLTLAFELLCAETPVDRAPRALRAARLVGQAAGEAGMVGGQAIDMAWTEKPGLRSAEALFAMQGHKTGALIRCAAEVGALLGGGSEPQIESLRDYGANLGTAFQIVDDLLDVSGDPDVTGKATSDDANGKFTVPALFGVQTAERMAREASRAALDALSQFKDEAEALRALAEFVTEREH